MSAGGHTENGPAPRRLGALGVALARRMADGPYARWRLVNAGLACLSGLLALWVAWLLVAPAGTSVDRIGPAVARAAAELEPEKVPAVEYRQALKRKRLFVLPTPTPTGPKLSEVIARAKERVALRGIVQSGDRLGAYFEVRGGGRETSTFNLYFEGDQVAEFTVQRIEPTLVVLVIAGEEVVFPL